MDMTAMTGDSSSAPGKGNWSARSAGERAGGQLRDVVAMPRLAQADRQAATAVLVPLLDTPAADRVWVAVAFLLGAIARDAFGNPDAVTGRAAGHRCEAVTHSETRVLYYLPTNLSAREIAGELHLS
jgi:hypothetical protein